MLFIQRFVLLMCALGFAATASAQIKFPQNSPKTSLSYVAGFTGIRIDYERPTARKREIFGKLVPYDKVWRTGAGSCTKITFTTPVSIDGKALVAGTYAIFSIPGKEEWTFIMNADTSLYGANDYDEKKDILRLKLKAEKAGRFYEAMTFDVDVADNNATVYLAWENTQIHFAVATDANAKAMAAIADLQSGETPAKKPEEFVTAASYLLMNNGDNATALKLIEQGIAAGADVSAYTAKIRVLEKLNRKADAVAAAKAGMEYVKTHAAEKKYDVAGYTKYFERAITRNSETSK